MTTSAASSPAGSGRKPASGSSRETTDLGTRFAKMAVTDERGRYVMPDLPKAHYRVWVRGYGLVEFAEGRGRARQDPQPDRRGGAEPCRRGAILSGDLLGLDDPIPGPEPLPRHRRQRQRHPEDFKTPGAVAQFRQDQWLRQLPPDRQLRDADLSPELGHFDSSLDAWSRRLSVGPAGHDMVNFITQLMTPGRRASGGARRLDRPHQGRRVAEPHPAAAGRHRAQSRRHGARLARPQALPARPDADRQAQPDRQRLRPDLRRRRAQQQPAGARPGPQHQDDDEAAGAAPIRPVRRSPTRSSRRRPIGAWSRSGTARSMPTTR